MDTIFFSRRSFVRCVAHSLLSFDMQEVGCCGAKASCCAVEAVDESAVVHESVREYYGKVLQKTADLQTNACCTSASLPKALKEVTTQHLSD